MLNYPKIIEYRDPPQNVQMCGKGHRPVSHTFSQCPVCWMKATVPANLIPEEFGGTRES